jgi:hypothetical protein
MLLSLVIVAITNILNLAGNEHSIYIMLERIDMMNEKDTIASKLVSKYVNLYRKMKKKQKIDVKNEREQFAFAMHEFKAKAGELSNSFPAYSEMDNIRDHLHFLEVSSHEIQGRYIELSKLMDKVIEKVNIKFK